MIKNICCVAFRNESKEELLPDFEPDFPCISSYVDLEQCTGHFLPWHWHKEIELFYIEKGVLEYRTSKGKMRFPEGSGGLVNSNVLHMTRAYRETEHTVQVLHLFDAALIGGQPGSRIDQKYVAPLITAPQIEILAFYEDVPEHRPVLDLIRGSFQYTEKVYAYEIKLRASLSEVWYRIFDLAGPLLKEKGKYDKTSDHLKRMMLYIHERYAEKLSIAEIAAAAFISERECFRAFQDCLRITPVEYIKSYRVQKACRLLAGGRESIADVGHACGLGSSSYFGKVFRDQIGCTPVEYRRRWQDLDRNRQESDIF